jgi:hypothetical protein
MKNRSGDEMKTRDNVIVDVNGLDERIHVNQSMGLGLDGERGVHIQDIVEDIIGLDELTSELRGLMITNTNITEIKGLDRFTKLEHLDLSFNKITRIRGLKHLTNLKILNLMNNQITSTGTWNRAHVPTPATFAHDPVRQPALEAILHGHVRRER